MIKSIKYCGSTGADYEEAYFEQYHSNFHNQATTYGCMFTDKGLADLNIEARQGLLIFLDVHDQLHAQIDNQGEWRLCVDWSKHVLFHFPDGCLLICMHASLLVGLCLFACFFACFLVCILASYHARLFACKLAFLFTYLFVHVLIYLLASLLPYLLTCLLAYLLACLPVYLLNCLFISLLTCWRACLHVCVLACLHACLLAW